MRSPIVIVVLLILLGVALPIAIFQGLFGGNRQLDASGELPGLATSEDSGELDEDPTSAFTPASPEDGPVSNGSDGVGAGGVTPVSTVATKAQKRYHVHGYFRHGVEAQGDSVLKARLAKGEREAITSEAGAFSLYLAAQDFPVRVFAADEALVMVLAAPPQGDSLFVNLHTIPAAAFAATRGLLQPTGISAEENSTGYRIRVYGTARLGVEHRLTARLRAAQKSISENLCALADPPLLAELEVKLEDLFSGVFDLELAWRVGDASSKELETLSQYLPAARQALPQGEVRAYLQVYLGRRYEEEVQERKVDAFYQSALGALESARDLLLLAALEVRGASNAEFSAATRDRLHSSAHSEKVSRLKGAGAFPAAAWRDLVDRELPELWQICRVESAIPVPKKYPVLSQNLGLAHDTIVKFSLLESRLQYQHAGLTADARDAVEIEFNLEQDWEIHLGRLNKYIRSIKSDLKDRRDP